MNDGDRQHAEEIFAAALEIADAAGRRAYLERTCAGDGPLRREVLHETAQFADDRVRRLDGRHTATTHPRARRRSTDRPRSIVKGSLLRFPRLLGR